MPDNTIVDSYSLIQSKIHSLKGQYQFLRGKPDDYVFSALCIKNSIYKNPSLNLSEEVLSACIVDGSHDGGADFLLLDPNNNEASDLIIGQAKYYSEISTETAKNAINKMIDFYLNMRSGNYGNTREDVIRRFTILNAEVGDESKIKFMLYVSAKQNSIKIKSLEKVLKERIESTESYELSVFFAKDIEEEIKDAESRRPSVEEGKLILDSPNNALWYSDDEAVVVNISAKSLKKLYAKEGTNLLAKNLRYFIKGKSDVNTDVKDTIKNGPDSFWYKNNGITIVCDSFKIDGKELKLKNFSIVNGGQTTYLIFKNGPDESMDDFFIVCKVISAQGDTDDEKSLFVLDIAKATNSQKPIKQSDLKANAPEQIRFANAMKDSGVFYKTKRGEEIPSIYKIDYKNSDISDVGKLSLAGIFQLPAASRNKPSSFYNDKFYEPTFNNNQNLVSKYMRDLLYIDFYFRKRFLYKKNSMHEGAAILPFAHNSRTICIAFVALGARIMLGNISGFESIIAHAGEEGFYDSYLYPVLNNYDNLPHFIKPEVFNNSKDELDSFLFNLFERLVKEGYKSYESAHSYDPSLNETNYLKKDSNYFKLLKQSWYDLEESLKNNKDLFI